MPKKQPEFEEDSFSDDDGSFDDDDFDDDDFDVENDNQEKTGKEIEGPQKPKINKHLLQLKEKLGLDAVKGSSSSSNSEKKPLAATKAKKGNDAVVVVYNDPSKRKKIKQGKEKAGKVVKTKDVSRPEFNINTAKHEVRKLAISSLGKTSRAEAQAQLAISLGAIPPKKKPVNYKVLKEMKKKEKAEIEEQKQNEVVFAARISQMAKKKPSKNKNKVANFDADFGKATKVMKNKGRR